MKALQEKLKAIQAVVAQIENAGKISSESDLLETLETGFSFSDLLIFEINTQENDDFLFI